jgi:hypothetical protein
LRYLKIKAKQTEDAEERAQLKRKISRIEKWISEVDDHLVRDIIVYRYEKGFKWAKISRLVGGDNTEDNCRMMVSRYLLKCKK